MDMSTLQKRRCSSIVRAARSIAVNVMLAAVAWGLFWRSQSGNGGGESVSLLPTRRMKTGW